MKKNSTKVKNSVEYIARLLVIAIQSLPGL